MDDCFLCSQPLTSGDATAYVAAAGLRVHRACLHREAPDESSAPPTWTNWEYAPGKHDEPSDA